MYLLPNFEQSSFFGILFSKIRIKETSHELLKENTTKMKIQLIILFLITQLFSTTAQEQEIVVEDFEYNPEGWVIEDNSNTKTYINNGAYYIINKVTNQPQGSYKEIVIDTDDDYTIEIKILQKKGRTTNGFGLIWGRASDDDYFRFEVKYDGVFKIHGKKAGTDFVIQDWKKLKKKQIKRMGQSHTLSIVKTDKGTTYLIDETKVYSGKNLDFKGHQLGTKLDYQMEVKVDFIRVIRKEA